MTHVREVALFIFNKPAFFTFSNSFAFKFEGQFKEISHYYYFRQLLLTLKIFKNVHESLM